MIINEQLFWGRDQFEYIKQLLNNEDITDRYTPSEKQTPIASSGL